MIVKKRRGRGIRRKCSEGRSTRNKERGDKGICERSGRGIKRKRYLRVQRKRNEE